MVLEHIVFIGGELENRDKGILKGIDQDLAHVSQAIINHHPGKRAERREGKRFMGSMENTCERSTKIVTELSLPVNPETIVKPDNRGKTGINQSRK